MDDAARPRVAIVDDHPWCARGIADLMRREIGADIVMSSDRMEDVLEIDPLPDLLLLDLDLGTSTADPQLAESLVRSGVPVLVVSALWSSPKAIRDMLRSGVAGFINKKEPLKRSLPRARGARNRPLDGPGNSRGHRRRSPPPSSVPARGTHLGATPRPQTRVGRTRGGSQPADRQDVREPHPGQIRTGGPAGSDEDRPLPRGGARRLPRRRWHVRDAGLRTMSAVAALAQTSVANNRRGLRNSQRRCRFGVWCW